MATFDVESYINQVVIPLVRVGCHNDLRSIVTLVVLAFSLDAACEYHSSIVVFRRRKSNSTPSHLGACAKHERRGQHVYFGAQEGEKYRKIQNCVSNIPIQGVCTTCNPYRSTLTSMHNAEPSTKEQMGEVELSERCPGILVASELHEEIEFREPWRRRVVEREGETRVCQHVPQIGCNPRWFKLMRLGLLTWTTRLPSNSKSWKWT